MAVLDIEKLITNRIEVLRNFHNTGGVRKAELDLSGGIDSAVMAYLLVQALGPKNVLLVHTNINTDHKQTERAEKIANGLGAPFINIDLTDVIENLTYRMRTVLSSALDKAGILEEPNSVDKWVEADPTILGSIRSCIRAPIGRGFNRMNLGGIRHGTGNECEDRFLRFYQKGGDGEVDTNPMEMLTKTEVFQLAYGISQWHFGSDMAKCFKELISVKPSPDLWGAGDDHNDEEEMKKWTGVPFTYGRVDPETGEVLKYGTIERIARFLDVDNRTMETVVFGERELKRSEWCHLAQAAQVSECFPSQDFRIEEIINFLKAARHTEKTTRHKENPAIPTLGNRQGLVKIGILTNRMN